jgi:hypothetical protein
MSIRLLAVLGSALLLAGCGQDGDRPDVLASPVSPTTVAESDSTGTPPPAASNVDVPFHSEVIWEKTMNEVPAGRCTRTLPAGLVYKWLTHNQGTHVSTHLGSGAFENNLCVFGTAQAPLGWYAEWIRWTAANGDVLTATSEFHRWTGTPGKSIAIETVTFHDGGTGRFQFAEGDGVSNIDPTTRTAAYDARIRYGRKDR